MARFTLPRDLYHGKGAMEALKTFQGKKAMICVGGGSMKKFGFLDKAVAYLQEAGMEVKLFEGIEPDPSVETVMKGAQAMLDFEPDWIVAMGGGSPIDAAKAMWAFSEYPETPSDGTSAGLCKCDNLGACKYPISLLGKMRRFSEIPKYQPESPNITLHSHPANAQLLAGPASSANSLSKLNFELDFLNASKGFPIKYNPFFARVAPT